MEPHIASVLIVKPTVQELKVIGLKKPIAMFSTLHVFASILLTKKVKFDRYNDSIKCTHMGQKLTYMVHKDKIWTSRGKIVKVKQFLELHPQYRILSIIEMFVLVSCTNLEPLLV